AQPLPPVKKKAEWTAFPSWLPRGRPGHVYSPATYFEGDPIPGTREKEKGKTLFPRPGSPLPSGEREEGRGEKKTPTLLLSNPSSLSSGLPCLLKQLTTDNRQLKNSLRRRRLNKLLDL